MLSFIRGCQAKWESQIKVLKFQLKSYVFVVGRVSQASFVSIEPIDALLQLNTKKANAYRDYLRNY
jgi:hypothetical protein